jgi:exodeoxyribonuclease VII large subunit
MTHTLYELNEHIRRVLALNFQQPIWIVAEVAQVGESRGHRYIDLVQKGDDGGVIAQGSAALWAAEYRQINARFPFGLSAILREGLELRLQVLPSFHERYGLKLHIADIDPAHTFGQLDLQRRKTIQTLREQGLLARNRSLPLPLVLQRIAVVSSDRAAGLQDFREHLDNNAFGYVFDCQYFTASVQGNAAPLEMRKALAQVAQSTERFDCAVIVRGGGAKLDLMAFDDLELCRDAALMPLPIFTGIGHDVDETVLDLVAHRSLKTPTAVADFLLQHNLSFEGMLLELGEEAKDESLRLVQNCLSELDRAATAARFTAKDIMAGAAREVDFLAKQIPEAAHQLLRSQWSTLSQMEAICQSLHPENVLKRGYSITYQNGKILRSAAEAAAGARLTTVLHDGSVESELPHKR